MKKPFEVSCDETNNSPEDVVAGRMNVKVRVDVFQPMEDAGGSDGLDCSHCGLVGVWPDEDGLFPSEPTNCAECGIEGHVTMDYTDSPVFQACNTTCERDVCPICPGAGQ